MKTKIKYFKANKSSILIFIFLLPLFVSSQTIENISLPAITANTHGGAMSLDIISANGFVFLYSFEKVMIFNTNNDYCGKILFPEQQSEQVEFGKFNPTIYTSRLYVGSANLMAYNDIKKILYIVTPSLNILHLNVDYSNNHEFKNEDITYSYNPFEDPDIGGLDAPSFKPLNGFNIIKCDAANNRLYWMLQGQNNLENDTGSFHKRKRFLGLYDINPNNSHISHHWSEVMATTDTTPYHETNISDIVFNTNNGSDYFYLSKLNQIEIRKFSDPDSIVHEYEINGFDYFDPINPNIEPYYKFSKLLYINEGQIHKIVALPYRIPFASPKPDVQSDIFVIDGDHDDYDPPQNPDPFFSQYASPSHRITDGEFLGGNNDLILCYAPDENEVIYHSTLEFDHDIATYHCIIPTPPDLPYFEEPVIYRTNNSTPIHDYDINASLKLIKVDNNKALISKKDEIVKLTFNTDSYSTTQLLDAENNLFMKGITAAGKSFINNPTANGLEVFINSNNAHSSIRTGYPVYHVTADADGDKLYLYNKLNAHGTGLYVCDINYENNTETIGHINNIGSNIGDCIYNPFTDHFLVSEFSGAASTILVYNNNGQNTSLTPIDLPQGVHYPEKMFIAPNKRLYVFANMLKEDNISPHIIVYAAYEFSSYSTYQLIDHYDITTTGTSDFVYYSGNFCYNKYDQKVYATIHPKVITLDPYLTENNSMYSAGLPFDVGTGAFFCAGDDTAYNLNVGLSRPMKMICPDHSGNSQYESKMFIIGDGFYVYDYIEETFSDDYEESFNDIIYSPVNDQVYGMKDTIGSSSGKLCNRKVVIQEINFVNGAPEFGDHIAEYPGQATAMFYNQYDGNIYVHHKFDQHKKAGTQVRLIYFDPTDSTIPPVAINLGLKCIYPELDHNGDLHYFMYNLITPYINPYNNTIYIPNGGHSCVSKVSFTPYEPLFLEEGGWTWLSFPRMIRDFNNAVWIPDVLNDNIEPDNYLTGSKLQNLLLGTSNIDESYFDDEYGWNYSGYLENIRSTLGYKLYLKYNDPPGNNILFLEGSLYDHFDPNCNGCTLNLVDADKYWVGYYYPISQNIIDAIPDEKEPFISVIKGQYFTCYGAPQSDGSVQWNCAINKRGAIINYGDMVEIIPVSGEDIYDFYWTINNNTPTDQEKAETVYYDYTETSDYTPIFIELDTTDNPIEIGAFVNDSCIGASTVLPEDSVVLVPAYSDSLNGEIYFEEYYGTQKSNQPPITEYYVTNTETRIREKRLIHTRERQDYYIVSFKNNITNYKEKETEDGWIKCRPNPLQSNSIISCYVPTDGFAEIKLYNIMGTEQLVLHSGMLSAGTHEFTFSAKDGSGKQLSNGTYILSIKSREWQAQAKVVVMK